MHDTVKLSGSHNAHARLSPSDSKRWTSCTAAIAFQEANAHRIPKDRGSVYSNEGTEAHDWAAKLLLGQITEADIPENFKPYVPDYVAHCLSLVPEGVKPEVEVEVPLWYQPEQHGTCDFAVVANDRVIVRDLKFGGGVLVTSEENTQLAIYGYSLIRCLDDVYEFGPDTVIDFAVFQPRHREGANQPAWVTTLGELEKFCEEIEYRAIQARNGADRVRAKLPCGQRDITPEEILEAAPGVKFEPGEGDEGACRWCGLKATCAKRLAFITEGLTTENHDPMELIAAMPDLDKDEKKLPAAGRVEARLSALGETVTDEFLIAAFAKTKALTSFLNDVAEYLQTRVENGEQIDGLKLVMGREGNRDWANEQEAETFLTGQKLSADERYTKKLISPTQAEKLLKDKLAATARTKTRFEQLITRSAAKPVLALADDKRPAVGCSVEVMPDLSNTNDEEQ